MLITMQTFAALTALGAALRCVGRQAPLAALAGRPAAMVRTRHRRRRTPSARALEVLACQPPHAPPPAKQPARSTPNSQLQARRRAARARAERDPYTRARNAVRAAVNKLRNDATLIEVRVAFSVARRGRRARARGRAFALRTPAGRRATAACALCPSAAAGAPCVLHVAHAQGPSTPV